MSHYTATIRWQAGEEDFTKHKYSRAHHWEFDGGSLVAASASPQIVPEPWSKPENVDPEEAFIASLASCHMLFFLDLAARAGFVVTAYEDNAKGTLAEKGDGVLAMTVVELRPAVNFSPQHSPTPDEVEAIHRKAHKLCFIANSVTTRIIISPQ